MHDPSELISFFYLCRGLLLLPRGRILCLLPVVSYDFNDIFLGLLVFGDPGKGNQKDDNRETVNFGRNNKIYMRLLVRTRVLGRMEVVVDRLARAWMVSLCQKKHYILYEFWVDIMVAYQRKYHIFIFYQACQVRTALTNQYIFISSAPILSL